MRTSRRGFLRSAAAGVAVPVLGAAVLDSLERRLEAYGGLSASDAVRQEEFWAEIRRVFPVPADYVNLENGYSSPQPAATYEAFQQHQKLINDGLSFYMRRRLADDYLATKTALAELAGVTPEEIVITRNTTESLGTVIHGLTYAAGDEAVMCDQDYGSMLQQFRQESRRHGLKCVEIPVPLTPRDDQEMVDTYARAITPRTKVVLLTHLINITGQILPVRKIAEMAHARGVAVIVDAAHSFAHVQFTVPELDGDYLGASLHKWLCTPLGAGLLYVRKDRIPTVWPLLGDSNVPHDDIRKLEHLGTQPSWTMLAIPDAIRFHKMIGAARKEARLRFLQQYLDRQGARHAEGVPEHADGGPRLWYRERRGHRDDAEGARRRALRQVQGVHRRDRHRRGEGCARDAAPVHEHQRSRRARRRARRDRPGLAGHRRPTTAGCSG